MAIAQIRGALTDPDQRCGLDMQETDDRDRDSEENQYRQWKGAAIAQGSGLRHPTADSRDDFARVSPG
jgi:hypothetical protein